MVRAFDYTEDKDLESVFKIILHEMSEIIETISKTIIKDCCLKHGYPDKDRIYKNQFGSFKISEFISFDTP